MKFTKAIVITLIAILASTTIAAGSRISEGQNGILYVKPGEEGDCYSWDTACDLQAALALAEAGDQVWVAAGTYKPTTGIDRTATFLLESGVAIYGGFAGTETALEERDWETNLTTLSGDIGTEAVNTDNSFHVVTGSGLSDTTILDGFTITAANANGGSSTQKVGGGMYLLNSSPTLTNITFSGNLAVEGGGMSNQGGSPTLTSVTFTNNSAGSNGGGMYNIENSSPTLTSVILSYNSAGNSGGGMTNSSSSPTLTNVTFSANDAKIGGGMSNYSSSPTLTNVTFSGNSANYPGDGGGGMYNEGSSPTVSHTTFFNNTAYNGGGMTNSSSSPTLTNVTFSDNTATVGGGGIRNYSFSGTLTNVTFYGNTASSSSGGGAMKSSGSSPTVTNSIFWGNTPDQLSFIVHSYPVITYSIIQGETVWDGIGNDNSDPLLVGLADNGGFTQTHALGDSSSAIDAGSPTLCPSMDQRGFHRPIDGDENTSEICDIGAYEYASNPEVFTLTADSEGNGSVAIDPDQTEYQFGEIVSLTASADPGWSFSGWSVDATGTTNPLTISILDDTSIKATFTQDEYNLILTPIGSGLVTINPVHATYHYGDVVTLTPTANPGWTFSGWGGDANGSDNPLTYTIVGNTSITATFTQDEYTLTVTPIGSGTVLVDPIKDFYHYGDQVTLKPTADPDWEFTNWSGDADGTDNPLTITILGDTNITANFEQVIFRSYLPLTVR